MSKQRLTLTLLVLAVALATAGGASRAQARAEVTEEFHQTYPLAAGGRVAVSNINGRVRVAAWDRSEVKVDAVKRAYSAERLREAEIRVDAAGGGVEIETEYAGHHERHGNWTREDQAASVDYTLTVPRGARLEELKVINGALEIEGVGGPVRASSVNGRVTARNLAGAVNISVVNGRLDAGFDRLGAPVSLSSVNGGIELTIPSDASAHLRADSVHGRINNDFNLPVREGEYVGRELEGRLGAGGARLSLSNVNGAISIRRASDGRALSPATNLLSETPGRGRDHDPDVDVDVDAGVDVGEIQRAAREAEREAREAAREAEREAREALREAERELREAEVETHRAERDTRQAQVEAERVRREAQREAERELRAAERETARAAREAERIAREVGRDVAAGMAATGEPRQIARESNSFAVRGRPRVRVETFDGAINVRAWDKPEVMFTAVKRAFNDREMQGIKVLAQNGPEITIRAEFDKSHARELVEREGRVVSFSSGASVELDLYVPREAALALSSGDGRLGVEGVTGELDLRTGDGPVDVVGGGGRLRVSTGDGRIRIENFEGEADARTGDGRITLDGRFRALSARTGDGTIALALPEGASADIETDAETVINDGVATALNPSDESRVRRFKVGGGGRPYTLRTGAGQVILRRR